MDFHLQRAYITGVIIQHLYQISEFNDLISGFVRGVEDPFYKEPRRMFAGDFYLNEDFIVLKYNGSAGDNSRMLRLCSAPSFSDAHVPDPPVALPLQLFLLSCWSLPAPDFQLEARFFGLNFL